MRYDGGYGRGYDRGWRGQAGGMPRYDDMFRGAGAGAAPPNWRRGRDVGRMGWREQEWDTAFGGPAHGSPNQMVGPGETDFLGRPYPRSAGMDRPWGLIEQERRQEMMERPRPRPRYGREYDARHETDAPDVVYGRGDERGYGMRGGGMRGPQPGPMRGGYGGPRMYGGSHGTGYDDDMRPDEFHPRFIPDGDEAGVDLHRAGLYRGDMRYNSNWTRWF
jgi:hypothetical protein